MNLFFSLTVQLLMGIASATGFTYNEINIIVYYMILPFIYLALLDRILRRHVLKIAFVLGWIILLCVMRDFNKLSDDLFRYSVEFLRLFSVVGLDYIAASVVICLVVPGLILAVLLAWAFYFRPIPLPADDK